MGVREGGGQGGRGVSEGGELPARARCHVSPPVTGDWASPSSPQQPQEAALEAFYVPCA